MRQLTKNELRCFCRRQPLLALYGLDEKGGVYVHIKVYKNRRLYGEILVTRGDVKIHCRECLRWHTVIIGSNAARLIETTQPKLIEQEAASDHV